MTTRQGLHGLGTPIPKAARTAALALVAVAATYLLLAHRSDEPFLFGYSLFYLICLLFLAGAVGFIVALFRRFKSAAWYAIAGIGILVSTFAATIEIVAQVYASRNPAYEVLYLEPDRQTGWKGVPNLSFTWAGPHWAAFEFSVPTVFNSAGFRDLDRTLAKPADVSRIALVGDSLVEALQVPFDKTAGQLLERSLNSDKGLVAQRAKYEVLNFGVSAYGLGQYLLAWQHYARAYQPDYVFTYVAKFHMQRTVSRGGMITQGSHDLWTRPTFRLHRNDLELVPAGQFNEFVAAQHRMIRNELGGSRMQKRPRRLFLRILLDDLNTRVTGLQKRLSGAGSAPDLSQDDLAVNLRVLEEFGKSVHDSGARLIVVDAVQYYRGPAELSATLQQFCASHGIGYVSLSEDLLRKENAGVSTKRAYDGHFNEVGNEVFANAMYRWVTSSASSAGSSTRDRATAATNKSN